MLFYVLFKNLFWGLGIGDWGLGPIPNPNPQSQHIKCYVSFIVLVKL